METTTFEHNVRLCSCRSYVQCDAATVLRAKQNQVPRKWSVEIHCALLACDPDDDTNTGAQWGAIYHKDNGEGADGHEENV